MKEMIKKVKERREGFTMAELLIVVAIIAVLVAIAIPVFTTQLEKSKEATDVANLRAAYAECAAAALTETAATENNGNGVKVVVDSTTKAVTCTKAVALNQGVDGWITEGNIAGVKFGAGNDNAITATAGKTVTVSVTSNVATPVFTTA